MGIEALETRDPAIDSGAWVQTGLSYGFRRHLKDTDIFPEETGSEDDMNSYHRDDHPALDRDNFRICPFPYKTHRGQQSEDVSFLSPGMEFRPDIHSRVMDDEHEELQNPETGRRESHEARREAVEKVCQESHVPGRAKTCRDLPPASVVVGTDHVTVSEAHGRDNLHDRTPWIESLHVHEEQVEERN